MRQSRRETGAWGSVATRGSVNGRGPCHRHGRDSTAGAYCPQALAPQAQQSAEPNAEQKCRRKNQTQIRQKN